MLKIGDKLVANFTEDNFDRVTKGKEYEVVEVFETISGQGFKIIDDSGTERMPIHVTFKKSRGSEDVLEVLKAFRERADSVGDSEVVIHKDVFSRIIELFEEDIDKYD